MAEITLGDLLGWERRLRAATMVPGHDPLPIDPGSGVNSATADRELTWAVTVRATTPMLPPLRGGELVLLPKRALTESGMTLAPLLRELAAHNAAAVVMEAEAVTPGLRAAGAPLPILVLPVGPLGTELEGELNRLLTERRGELYRAGTEVGRLLAGLTTAGADPRKTLGAAAEALALPIAVVDGQGVEIVAAAPPGQRMPAGGNGERHPIRLAGGETLWIGPTPAPRRALARLAGERVAVAVEAALARAAQTRPRGAARAAALEAFLSRGMASRDDAGTPVTLLGLKPAARYRVALLGGRPAETVVQQMLTPFGAVHPAGTIDGAVAAVVEPCAEPRQAFKPPPSRGAGARSSSPLGQTPPGVWVALSPPVDGPAALPVVTRQARYAAALLKAGLLPGPVVRFESVADLGAYRLLYREWGSEEGRQFADAALGELRRRDRRGALRTTLLTYLETGGSHVESAARLGIHRNTLGYRLKQIALLTDTDPVDPGNRLALHLALLIETLPPAPEEGGSERHRAA